MGTRRPLQWCGIQKKRLRYEPIKACTQKWAEENKSVHVGERKRCAERKNVLGWKGWTPGWRECGENTNIMMRVFRRYTLTIQARCIPARTLSAKNTRMKLPSRQSVKMLRTKYPNVQHPAGPLMWKGRRNILSNSVWEKLIWGNEVWWPVF